jgi:glycosyltransferase involved in cell wall biosynthesis
VPAGNGRVKVLWLIKGLGAGGAERLLWMFARTGDHASFDYQAAYVVPWASAMAPAVEAEGVPVRCLDGRHQLSVGWIFRLWRLLSHERPSIVHVHSPHVAAVLRLLVLTLPASRRPAVVSTEHCTWWSYRRATRWANAATCQLDTVRFAVSTQVKDSMWRRARGGVRVLVHGVLEEEVDKIDHVDRDAVRAAIGIGRDEVVIATVGNYRSQKAYSDLLAAARTVVDADRSVRFLAIGYGPLESEVRTLHERLGLGDRFLLLGYRRDVVPVLAASDLFALASIYEGGPIAVLEALACRLPVVVTSVGFVPDIVTDGVEGFVIPPGRPDELADRLLQLVFDPGLRARMALAASERGRSFHVEDAVHQLEATYRELHGARASCPDHPSDRAAGA